MCESTVGLSSETDASFYDAEAFELHIQAVLYSAGRGAKHRHTEDYCTRRGEEITFIIKGAGGDDLGF